MKRWPTVAMAAVLVGLISTPGITATSSDQKVVREAVVTTAAADGSPRSTLVSQLVQLSSKDGSNVSLTMPKVADLTSYRNLSGFSGPSGDSKSVVWHTTGSIQAQALAKIHRQLPFEVHVKYFLNGKEVKPNQVDGKDGRLKLQIQLVNASGDPKDLSYSGLSSPYLSGTTEEYVPFEYNVRVTFPQHSWTGVTGRRFDIAPLGTDQVASATGVISPPLTDVSDTVDVSAHSGDMLRPKIEVYAFPKINPNLLASLQTQYEALRALYNGTGQISANLVALYNGTLQLVGGLSQFMGGTGQLDSGISKIVAGVGSRNPTTGKPNITLDKNGQPNTVIGGIGFIADALQTAVLPGIGARDPKTGKAIITTSGGTPNTIIGALGSIEDAINSSILPAVGTRDQTTGKGVIVLDSLGNNTTLLGGLQGQKNAYDNSLIPGAEAASAGIDQLKTAVGLVNGSIGHLVGSLQTSFRPGLLAIQQGLNATVNGLSGPGGAEQGLIAISGGLAAIVANLGGAAGLPGITAALNQVSTALTALAGRLGTDARAPLLTLQSTLTDLHTNVDQVVTDVTTANTDATNALTPLPSEPAVVTALNDIVTKTTDALTKLGDTSTAASALGEIKAAQDGVASVLGSLGQSGGSATDIIPTVEAINTAVTTLVATIGTVSPTLIGGIQAAQAGVDQLLGAVQGGLVRLVTTAALDPYTRAGNVITGATNHLVAHIDGKAPAVGDRLLLKNGASLGDNGVYTVTQVGSGTAPFILTRAADFDSSSEWRQGATLSVTDGLTSAGSNWQLATPNPITLNTTSLTFVSSATPSFLGGAQLMLGGVTQLIAGLGTTATTPDATTVIGALELMQSVALTPASAGLGQLGAGIHNPAWDKPFCPAKQQNTCSAAVKQLNTILQANTTPHQLYSTCPGCFDATFKNYDASKGIKLPNGKYVTPAMLNVLRATNTPYSPGILEAFHLFSDGIRDSFPKLVSFDAKHPGLVDGLKLIADGLDTLTQHLQTFDPKDPGLVDGIQQIVAGLQTLGSKLQTFDPNNPGLVDGLQLVQGGIGQLNGGAQQLHSGGQQISSGVFAIDQLGLRVVHGQVGDSGDTVAQDQALLRDAVDKLGGTSTLAKADAASTTYVFEIAAASTATRDNLIRGGLIALLIALLVLMARRPSMLGL